MFLQSSALTQSKISEAAATSWPWGYPNSSMLSSSKVEGLHWLCWMCWLHSLSDLPWHFGNPAMSQHIWSLQGSSSPCPQSGYSVNAHSCLFLLSFDQCHHDGHGTTVVGHKVVCCPHLQASSLLQVKPGVWDYVFLCETLHNVNTSFCKWRCAQQLAKAPSSPVGYEPASVAGGQHGRNGIHLGCSAKCNIQCLQGHIGTKLGRNTRLCDTNYASLIIRLLCKPLMHGEFQSRPWK